MASDKTPVPTASSIAAGVPVIVEQPARHISLDQAIAAAPPGWAGPLRLLAGSQQQADDADGDE